MFDFQKNKDKSKKMKVILALNRVMSRRSREESNQRRDVGSNVTNFQREVKINVATLRSNVTTFQRRAKPMSRGSSGVQIQCRDVGIQRRNVPEKGHFDVVTLRHREVSTSRR